MPFLRDTILKLMPRTWREDAERESRLWKTTCTGCGRVSNIWDMGGLRWHASGRPAMGMRCPGCGRFTSHRIARN